MVKVLIKKLNPAVQTPTYKTSGASGMDLMAFIEEPIKLTPKKSCLVSTGISVAILRDRLDDYIYEQTLEDLEFVDEQVEIIPGHVPITYNSKVT